MSASSTSELRTGETWATAIQTGPNGLLWSQVLAALVVVSFCTWLYFPKFNNLKVPFVGYRSWWEPGLVARVRFAIQAPAIISEGYSKRRNAAYRISRIDGDLLVLPRKYLDELHNVPQKQLSSIRGLIKNFGGRYGGIGLLGESNIGTQALQSKITPNLVKLSESMRDELKYALKKEIPDCQEWTAVPIQPLLLTIIERITNRVFIGLPLCRNEEWLATAHKHSHNVTLTQIAMRAVPPFARPALDLILPTAWRYKAAVRQAKKILIPEIQRRRHLEETDPDYEKPNDLLQAMMDLSTPGDRDSQSQNLAHRQLLMTLVAGHSTAAAGCHALFDFVSRPHYLEAVRTEALEVLREEGGEWKRQSLSKLWKLDSFLRESQRYNPPIGFHRIVQDPAGVTLHDGMCLPFGTHVCITPHSVSRDTTIIPNADEFDGLRYFEQRRRSPDDATKHQHATADKDHLHFGYGTWSCPGRFLASAMLKMTIAELLLRYDFQYSQGKSRPVNSSFEEFPYVDVETPLLMRCRERGNGNLNCSNAT
uniref:p450 monooxygenase-like protein n=1 Tax=Epichloe aotearoae TaxID=170559 RepID=R9URF2_EPIAO|nr:P450 monooxygenase-like protein [Epichloe aotearoae]